MRKLRSLAAIMAVISLLCISCEKKNDGANTITVTAAGSAGRVPDIAELTFGVDTRSKSVKEAFSKNQEAMKNLKAKLLELGIDESSMKTTNYSVRLGNDFIFEKSNNQEEFYRVNNSVSIVLRDINSIGMVIDAAINAGANELNSLKFRVSDMKGAEEEAHINAMENARTKAEIMARAAGRKLGKAVTISAERGSSSPGYVMASMISTVSPGESEISSNVTVIYTLK